MLYLEDYCCDYEAMDILNNEVWHPSVQEAVKIPFFLYFKAGLWCDCPFWPDDDMFHLQVCSVCKCPADEFPESFKTPNS